MRVLASLFSMNFSFPKIIAIPLILSSCASFQSHPISAEQTSAEFSQRSLTDPSLKAFLAEQKAGGGAWTVDRLALAAAYFHPDVALARAEADEAAAAIKTAEMRPNPVFSFAPQVAANSVSPVSPWFFTPTMTVPIETAGKRSKRTACSEPHSTGACRCTAKCGHRRSPSRLGHRHSGECSADCEARLLHL